MRGMRRCLIRQDLGVRENRSPVEASYRRHGIQHHGGRAVNWNHDSDSPIPGKLLLDSSLELRQSDCSKRRFDQLKRSGEARNPRLRRIRVMPPITHTLEELRQSFPHDVTSRIWASLDVTPLGEIGGDRDPYDSIGPHRDLGQGFLFRYDRNPALVYEGPI